MPSDEFTDKDLKKLRKLMDSKAGLIKKTFGAAALPIEVDDETVVFPWFPDILPDAAQAVQAKWEQEKVSRIDHSHKCAAFINQIKGRGVIEDFDEGLSGSIVDKISVVRNKIVFEFKDGETKEYIVKRIVVIIIMCHSFYFIYFATFSKGIYFLHFEQNHTLYFEQNG